MYIMHVIFTVEHVEQNVSVAQENKHDKLKTLINETVAPQALPIARRLPLHPHAQTDQYIYVTLQGTIDVNITSHKRYSLLSHLCRNYFT